MLIVILTNFNVRDLLPTCSLRKEWASWSAYDRAVSHLLQIQIGASTINCHFFAPTEIELNIDPREVADEATHEAVLAFLESLSLGTGKDLVIAAENCPESPCLTFSPESNRWIVHE